MENSENELKAKYRMYVGIIYHCKKPERPNDEREIAQAILSLASFITTLSLEVYLESPRSEEGFSTKIYTFLYSIIVVQPLP